MKSMRAVRWVAAAAVLATGFSAAAQDPLVVGPDIYKKVLDNERVRLMQVEFAPGASIGMHSHPDHAAYVLAGGAIALFFLGAAVFRRSERKFADVV